MKMMQDRFSGADKRILSLANAEDIFVQGEPAGYFFILLSGKADLMQGQRRVMQLRAEAALGTETLLTPESGYLYTARAAGDIRVARYSCHEFLDRAVSGSRLMTTTLESQGALLRQLWLLSGSASKEEPGCFFPGEIRSCSPGEWVIRQGEQDDFIYRIVSTNQGLEVVKQGRVLAVLREPGDFFGEMAALLGEKRTAGVRSVGDSVLEVYPGDLLDQMITDYPFMSRRIIKNLAHRLARTSRELTGQKDKAGP